MGDRTTIIAANGTPDWGDPWRHPEYFTGITIKRVVAYGIDFLLIGFLGAIIWFMFGLLGILSLGLLLPLQALAVALTPFVYHIGLIASSRSATLGMRVMGIRVLSISETAFADSGRPTPFQAMIQTLGFYGSVALTSFLILIVALFNPRRRMIHDWLAGTVVVNDIGQWHRPSI